MSSEHARTPEHDGPTDEEVWLLGQPPVGDYLRFVKDMVVGGEAIDPALLAREWRAANDYYHELEQREVGIADRVEHRDIDPSLAPLVEELGSSTTFRRTFDVVPTSIAMVELDRMVVFQKSVTQTFVDAIAARLPERPSPEELFRFALPVDHPNTPIVARRAGSKRWLFRSDSTDFRTHDPVLLQPDQVHGYQTFGPLARVLAFGVGFGSNFFNAVRVGKRFVLHNGYHRACALRSRGVTHAPCVVQTVTRSDELELVAKSNVVDDPDFYFKTARPPLLRDFFDPKIRRSHRVHKLAHMVEVELRVREFTVAD